MHTRALAIREKELGPGHPQVAQTLNNLGRVLDLEGKYAPAEKLYLRSLEIRPFVEGNIVAALGAGSLFTMRAGWPPIIIPHSIRDRFNPAVSEGLKMNTRPLIDLFAESICETLESLIKLVKSSSN